MKRLVYSIIVIAFTLGLHSTDALAKSRRKITKKNDYSALVYEGVWFSQLSEKQQVVYLQTIEKLTMQLTRGGVAQLDSSFLKYFVSPADAANRINNGFIFDGSNDDADYDAFLAELNVLGSPIDPGCSGRNQVCAPYLGMVCSGGRAQLACSPDSTPTCAARGSLDCLRTALSSCGMDEKGQAVNAASIPSSSYCQSLDRVMRRGTQNVEGHCSSGSRSAANYCRQAVARLQGNEIPTSPDEANPPTGGDCEKMIRTLGEIRDSDGGRRENDKGVANNSYWRNMTGFAQQACGSTVTKMTNTMGICSERNMAAPDGTLQRSTVNTFSRSDNAAGFSRCISSLEAQINARRDERIAEVRKEMEEAGRRERNRVLARVRDLARRDIERMKASKNASGECSLQEKEAITDRNGQNAVRELELSSVMSLASKVRDNNDLTQEEENRFRAATGLSSNNFRTAFCQSTTHDAFKKALAQASMNRPRISGSGSIANLLQGQADVAHHKMGRCLGKLRSNTGEDGANCRLHVIEDANALRCASENFPILALNRESNRCTLVTGFNRRVTSRDNNNNPSGQEVRLNIRTPSGTSETKIRSESFFSRSHQLQEYRCDGDRSLRSSGQGRDACWMKPRAEDPARAGEGEAKDVEL